MEPREEVKDDLIIARAIMIYKSHGGKDGDFELLPNDVQSDYCRKAKRELNEENKIEEVKELLPCPFCGSEAKLNNEHHPEFKVECTKIGCCPGHNNNGYTYKKDAIGLWNTRPSKPVETNGLVPLYKIEIQNFIDDLIANQGLCFQIMGNSYLPNHQKDLSNYISESLCAKFGAPP